MTKKLIGTTTIDGQEDRLATVVLLTYISELPDSAAERIDEALISAARTRIRSALSADKRKASIAVTLKRNGRPVKFTPEDKAKAARERAAAHYERVKAANLKPRTFYLTEASDQYLKAAMQRTGAKDISTVINNLLAEVSST